jgi:hypothetical protein
VVVCFVDIGGIVDHYCLEVVVLLISHLLSHEGDITHLLSHEEDITPLLSHEEDITPLLSH